MVVLERGAAGVVKWVQLRFGLYLDLNRLTFLSSGLMYEVSRINLRSDISYD